MTSAARETILDSRKYKINVTVGRFSFFIIIIIHWLMVCDSFPPMQPVRPHMFCVFWRHILCTFDTSLLFPPVFHFPLYGRYSSPHWHRGAEWDVQYGSAGIGRRRGRERESAPIRNEGRRYQRARISIMDWVEENKEGKWGKRNKTIGRKQKSLHPQPDPEAISHSRSLHYTIRRTLLNP